MSRAAPTSTHRVVRDDVELAFRTDKTHHAADLIAKWGLSLDERRRAYPVHDIRLDFDAYDRAHAHRTVADVWARSDCSTTGRSTAV